MGRTYTTSQAARLLRVAVTSVSNWIEKGLLRAGRTPGGHRRIEAEQLAAFARKQGLRIPPELERAAPVRVLVVDDEPEALEWIASEIRAECPDYEVATAGDGFAAGQAVASLKPTAVILDLRMPGMDGYEVCRRIKAAPETADTVVIAITAAASEAVEERILSCGAKVLLHKPLDAGDLLRELAAAVNGAK